MLQRKGGHGGYIHGGYIHGGYIHCGYIHCGYIMNGKLESWYLPHMLRAFSNPEKIQ